MAILKHYQAQSQFYTLLAKEHVDIFLPSPTPNSNYIMPVPQPTTIDKVIVNLSPRVLFLPHSWQNTAFPKQYLIHAVALKAMDPLLGVRKGLYVLRSKASMKEEKGLILKWEDEISH